MIKYRKRKATVVWNPLHWTDWPSWGDLVVDHGDLFRVKVFGTEADREAGAHCLRRISPPVEGMKIVAKGSELFWEKFE